jgi:electron transfer flavoprotein alpha subunit
VAGHGCGAVAQAAAKVAGVKKVLIADAPHYANQLAENVAALVVSLASGYSHILAPATAAGKNTLPRVAALLDVAQSPTFIKSRERRHLRPADLRRQRAGHRAVQRCGQGASRCVAPLFRRLPATGGSASIETVAATSDAGVSSFVGQQLTKSDRPELTAARIIVSGGRGMGNGENFKLLEEVADKLGAAVGASRAAVDAGFVPNDYQVGQTGKVVAPELYVAVGISGAIQHLAGMKDSKVIVAINKDEEAPIFPGRRLRLVADLFVAMPNCPRNWTS